MKKNLLVFTILVSMFSVVNVSQANAGDCNANDPCGVWAMLDSQGVVTNTIVCQASVCGGGTWAGQTVVPQVAPNPITHDSSGVGGMMDSGNKEFYYEDNTFKLSKEISKTEFFQENEKEISITTNISQYSLGFTYEETKNSNESIIKLKEIEPKNNTKVSIFAETKNNELTEKEEVFFSERKTQEEVSQEFNIKNVRTLIAKINNIIKMLGLWVKN
jgi:hypothetical protein